MQKSVLITGCSSGIGLESALELKRQGFWVLAACRKPEDVERMNNMGFAGVLLDLDCAESIERAADEVIALTGNRLYGLFNNAGFGVYGPLQSITRQQLEQQFSANFWRPSADHAPAARHAAARRGPHCDDLLGDGAYLHARPWGLRRQQICAGSWSDALRMELRHSGIKVSLIEPGPIRTRFTDNVNQTQADKPVENPGIAARFTLGPEAVVAKVRHALRAKTQNALSGHAGDPCRRRAETPAARPDDGQNFTGLS